MNSRASSGSFSGARPRQGSLRRGSVSSRLSFAASSTAAEAGEAGPHDGGHGGNGGGEHHQIEEEIAEIKRYEDFTTIDWVQDAAREQQRRKARRRATAGRFDLGRGDWRYRVWESYDAAQGWIVVTIIGAAIGLNAAFLNIVTEWLSDVKLGYCKTGFYLNEKFCCWGEDNGCADWHRWAFEPVNYLLYVLFATAFAAASAVLVKSFAPYAAGSGISEIKCIIAGFVMKGFLGAWTLVIKSVALPLAIASGLSVGKEGPSVHYAVCTGNVISRLFDKYRRNASKTREILSACAAAGVAVAFGSPIGGVLFSLEEMSSHFPLKTMWRSYFCALVATAVLAAMNPFRTGQLVMFQVRYDRSWHFFEVLFYVVIGVFGGLYGEFVIKWNLRAQEFRRRYLSQYAILEATILAAATAIVCYPNVFLQIDMTESMEILFLECEGAEDYRGLCDADKRAKNIFLLVVATLLRMFLVIISYGCKVPAGIFVPSMAIGASFGRTVGIVVQAIHEAYPNSVFFSACAPDVPCITPGTYAFLGAAAALSGIMHITVSVVVIMFELTGALTYILPTMIVVGVVKVVSSVIGGKGGIADRMIWFSGFPYLDNKEEHNFGVPVSRVMTSDVVCVPVTGMTLAAVEQLLSGGSGSDNGGAAGHHDGPTPGARDYQGFPVVEEDARSGDRMLVGYIGRTELRYAVDRVRRERGSLLDARTARCTFAPAGYAARFPTAVPVPTSTASVLASSGPSLNSSSNIYHHPLSNHHHATQDPNAPIDLSRYVDLTPVTAHPRLPLETVMELFRKIGPRVVLIEHRGRLVGLVTVKDCLKYQFKVEASDGHGGAGIGAAGRNGTNGSGNLASLQQQERLWQWIRAVAAWVAGRIEGASGGRIRLGSPSLSDGRLSGERSLLGRSGRILEGTEDLVSEEDEDGVELDVR